jgi:hypothetical protein
MWLFVVFLRQLAMLRRGNSRHSRFGGFNSRLGGQKFPVRPLREFAQKRLIQHAVLAANGRLYREKRRNSRFDGKTGKLACRPAPVS